MFSKSTAEANKGMIVSPHHLASRAGLSILRQGGTAVEAAVATAAALSVVYPHMTGIGGDGFWLLLPARDERNHQAPTGSGMDHPLCINAAGCSAGLADLDWYAERGCASPPKRGPLAALTMAGAVSGWEAALQVSSQWAGYPGKGSSRARPLSRSTLLAEAIRLAENGFPVSASQSEATTQFYDELSLQPGFAPNFLPKGKPAETGARMRLKRLASTLRKLAEDGWDSFYRGELAASMAKDLEMAGSPLRLDDFHNHRPSTGPALSLELEDGVVYNAPPPTQGVASLLILGLVERLADMYPLDLHDPVQLVHIAAEATKAAFALRDAHICDTKCMAIAPESLLDPAFIRQLAATIRTNQAAPWNQGAPGGDTVWIGALDGQGNMVSYIQSLYHEFGSGMVLPETGVVWNNRGLGFCFDKDPVHPNRLEPDKQPLHTLNPALAIMKDGRRIAYGTMGGDGQPQTQAAIFLRAIKLGLSAQAAIDQPRWLLGRSWGDPASTLKLEDDFPSELGERLKAMGHDVELTGMRNPLMGHAGMIIRHPCGRAEGAADPRGDGIAAGW